MDGEDVFGLHFGEDGGGVFGHALEDDEEVTSTESGVWAQGHEVVGEIVGCYGEVSRGSFLPFGAEFLTGETVDGKSILESCVEPCGADNGIYFTELAICGSYTRCGNAFYGSGNDFDVFASQRFKVARAWSQAFAKRRKIRQHVLCNLGFFGQTVRH